MQELDINIAKKGKGMVVMSYNFPIFAVINTIYDGI